MRYLFSIFSLLVLIGMLSSCEPIYETEYSYSPPTTKTNQICATRCLQAQAACERICALKNENCLSRSQGFSANKCKKVCNCKVSYNTCYSACGGQVMEKKVLRKQSI